MSRGQILSNKTKDSLGLQGQDKEEYDRYEFDDSKICDADFLKHGASVQVAFDIFHQCLKLDLVGLAVRVVVRLRRNFHRSLKFGPGQQVLTIFKIRLGEKIVIFPISRSIIHGFQ